MRGDCQHRNVVAVAIKQAVNQVQVAWPTRACADGQLARQLRFSARGEGSNLFMAGWHPVNCSHTIQTIAQTI